MKHCPECKRKYNDPTINFCLEDGQWLLEDVPDPITAVLPVDARGEVPTKHYSVSALDPLSEGRNETDRNVGRNTGNYRPRFLAAALVTPVILACGAAAYWYLSPVNPPLRPISVSRPVQISSWSGLDLFPTVSADGGLIAFSSDRSGSFEIYVRQIVNGARDVQVTSDGNENLQPTISSDGSLIAFHSKKRGGIWVIPSTGGTPKQLATFGSSPAFSPDGSQIAFQSDPLNDLGSNVRNALPPSTIWSVATNGGEPVQLTKKGEAAGGHGHPSWSPDGKRVVFDISDWASSRIGCLDLGSSQVSTSPDGGEPLSDPVFSSDGQYVYVSANMNSTLQRIHVDGCGVTGEPEDLFDSSGGRIRQMAVDRVGKRIVYSTIATTSNIWSARITPAGLGEPEQLTRFAHTRTIYPSFSPDGKKIAFQKFSAGNLSHIWVMNNDGSDEKQISTNPGICTAWERNGGRIWFIFQEKNGSTMSYINPDNSSEKKAFEFAEDIVIARPSPDGKRIAFQSKQTGTTNVFIRSVEDGETKQITFDEEFAGFPAWSPDGSLLAIQLKRGENSFIAVVPSGGGPIKEIDTEPGQSWVSDWSADGDEVLFAGQREGIWNLYSVSRITGKQRKLTSYSKPNTYVRYPVWSPADDRVAFEFAETTGNIWMVELK